MAMRSVSTRAGLSPMRLLAAAGIGAVLGSAWDLLHVRTHTTIYAIGAGRIPLWVPVEFALVYLAGVAGITALGSPHAGEGSSVRVGAEALWVTVAYTITAVGHAHELVVALSLAAMLVIRLPALKPVVRSNAVPAVALVVGGPVVETILVSAGVFRYTHASLGEVAVWLPLLYANAVPFAVRLTEWLAVEPPA